MNGAFIAMQSMMQASSTSMRNAMEANQSAYSMAYTEMTNIYANCQTVNPMGAKMCASCKNYDAQNYWCNLLVVPAASATMTGGACYRYKYWELNIDESLKKCCCDLNRTPEEKAFSEAIARELETIAAIKSWTFEEQEYKTEMPKFLKIPDDVFAAICGEPYKPSLELSDLYSLAFPFDPIQEHFAGIYKRIDAEYQKKKEILDRIKVKPVERFEPVEVLDNPKVNQESFQDWLDCEKQVAIFFAWVYAVILIAGLFLAFPVAAPRYAAGGKHGLTTRGQKSTSRVWKRLKGDAEMTRKRFVKLLMAERFDRNEANLFADYYNTTGVSYADAYKEMEAYRAFRVITENGNRVFKDFRSMVLDCTSTIFLSLADAMERMQEVFREVGNALREVNT